MFEESWEVLTRINQSNSQQEGFMLDTQKKHSKYNTTEVWQWIIWNLWIPSWVFKSRQDRLSIKGDQQIPISVPPPFFYSIKKKKSGGGEQPDIQTHFSPWCSD